MSFRLKHHQRFQQVLDHYTVSAQALEALKGLRFMLMLAPTSAGRNTIIRHLVSTGRYHYVVSDTTRPPRVNDGVLEQNGTEYWFRSEEEMLKDLEAGKFLEAELIHDQQVSGISIRELLKAKKENKIAITDIDLQGVHNIVRAKADVTSVMLLPPSYEEWQHRIKSRGEMSKEEYLRRLKTAQKISTDGLSHDYYHFVIAERVEQSAQILDSIASGSVNPHQNRGKKLLNQLLERLSAELETT